MARPGPELQYNWHTHMELEVGMVAVVAADCVTDTDVVRSV